MGHASQERTAAGSNQHREDRDPQNPRRDIACGDPTAIRKCTCCCRNPRNKGKDACDVLPTLLAL